MAFPKTQHCLLCEDVRIERTRLSTVIGLYGVCPNVDILLQEIGRQVERLTFFIFGGKGSGTFTFAFQVLKPDGAILIQTPSDSLTIKDAKRRSNLVITIGPVKFESPGTYKINLLVDGLVEFSTSFEVLVGQPEDFE